MCGKRKKSWWRGGLRGGPPSDDRLLHAAGVQARFAGPLMRRVMQRPRQIPAHDSGPSPPAHVRCPQMRRVPMAVRGAHLELIAYVPKGRRVLVLLTSDVHMLLGLQQQATTVQSG